MTRSGWLGLLVAVLAVAAALWVLERPRRGQGTAAADGAEPGGGGGAPGAAERGSAGGVAAREATVAADGWVRGQVRDADGQPLTEGRLVLWCHGRDGRVARIEGGVLGLDGEGRFEGPGCRGEVCPELRHPAMIPATPWSLRPGTEAVLEARPLPRLRGRVVDPGGEPIAAAQIVLTPLPDDDPTVSLPVVSARTSSDADGEFSLARLERPPCDPCQQAREACPDPALPVLDRVLITARAEGWAPGERAVELPEDAEGDEPLEVVLPPARAAITGRLVDAEGGTYPRGFVLARSEVREHEQHRAEASDGVFALDGLGDGPYTVRALQDGRELARRGGVEPGDAVELVTGESLIDVELEIVDAGGDPLPGVRVDGGPFERERTDPRGRVRAERVAPAAYILRIRPRGFKTRAHDLRVEAPPQGPEIPLLYRIELDLTP